MTTPVTSVMSTISTLWEAATPPDRTTKPYREIQGYELADAVNRSFWWAFPVREGTAAEGADGATAQVMWLVQAELYLSTEGRGRRAMIDAVANETSLLMRQVERNTVWPAGVIEVITQRLDAFEEEASGDVTATLIFSALVEET